MQKYLSIFYVFTSWNQLLTNYSLQEDINFIKNCNWFYKFWVKHLFKQNNTFFFKVFNLLSSLDEKTDGRVGISDGVKHSGSLHIPTIDVVHSQNAIIHPEI